MGKSKFSGQVVFITGASSGIGEALAFEFSKQGARVVLAARRLDRLVEVVKKIESQGGKALAISCDVTQPGEVEEAVLKTVEKFGKLTVLVANAGFGVAGAFETLTLEDYRRQFETNVFGVIRTAKAGFQELKKTQGRLVLLGSVAGHVALPGSSPYSMSKFCIRGMGEALIHELKPLGISVTLISPGFISSEIRLVDNQGTLHSDSPDPIPSWIRESSEKAARAIVHAVYKRKAEEVITAHGKIIVWIQRHFPWVIGFVKSRGLRGRPEPR